MRRGEADESGLAKGEGGMINFGDLLSPALGELLPSWSILHEQAVPAAVLARLASLCPLDPLSLLESVAAVALLPKLSLLSELLTEVLLSTLATVGRGGWPVFFSPALPVSKAKLLPEVGVMNVGEYVLRKSAYADGGEMGVLRACSSCLTTKGRMADTGLATSDGYVPDIGVLRAASFGFDGGAMVHRSRQHPLFAGLRRRREESRDERGEAEEATSRKNREADGADVDERCEREREMGRGRRRERERTHLP